MSRFRKILSTWLLVLTAFNILNQSIDLDYSLRSGYAFYSDAALDDVDTIAEFFLEKICGNEELFHDEDDDSGIPIFCASEKVDVFPFDNIPFRQDGKLHCANAAGRVLSSKPQATLLKGFHHIYSPPPDA